MWLGPSTKLDTAGQGRRCTCPWLPHGSGHCGGAAALGAAGRTPVWWSKCYVPAPRISTGLPKRMHLRCNIKTSPTRIIYYEMGWLWNCTTANSY